MSTRLNIAALCSLFLLSTRPFGVIAAPVGLDDGPTPAATNMNAPSSGSLADNLEVAEAIARLDKKHPGLGYLTPEMLKSSKNKKPNSDADGGFEVAENTNMRFTGTRPSVIALETHFGKSFEFNVDKLPKSAAAPNTPWPGDYFPTSRDGINFKWDGPASLSPVEKYAAAMGLNAKELSDALSLTSGIESVRSFRPACQTDSDCASLNDGSSCSFRGGAEGVPPPRNGSGVCVPGWFGICHAWAPAALLEPEPKCPVTVGNVTFKVNDLKALITQLYDGSGIETVFGGARCNDVSPTLDENGRYLNFLCRDSTPDLFHLSVTNMIGIMKTSFVADVEAKIQVWNQPAKGYEILQNKNISLVDGAKLVDPKLTEYIFNPMAASLRHVVTRFDYIVESRDDGPFVATGRVNNLTTSVNYEYLLELDETGRIVGGEWVKESKQVHPDTIWVPVARPADNYTVAGGINYGKVKELLTQSINAQC
ncbi:hypothetical protein HK102_012265 [Quaeritorhiza haematococci]|nr:hypothetical protein HK102_012265 [Quaeritorhiza haematococci]